MTKIETMRHLPTSEQVHATAQQLEQLPQAIVAHLTPILPNIDRAMEAQRCTIETLTAQAMQQIVQTQRAALQSIQAQQQTSERALIDALTRLAQQSNALQTLPKQTKQAAAQVTQAAQQMQQTARKYRPLRLWHVLALTLTSAVLAAGLTLAGMHAFANPVPPDAQQQTQQQAQQSAQQ